AEARKPFFRRVVDYFGESSRDKTFEKKLDITFIGGISYSQTTSLGFALMAAGQYRIDRTDSITQPSNVSLYGNVSLTGFYAVGVSGNTFFPHRGRMNYEVQFSSQPTDFWGIGYRMGSDEANKMNFSRKKVLVSAQYLYPVLKNTYVGASVDFNFTRGLFGFADSAERFKYIGDERLTYTATGLGLMVQYDSRDYITGPSRGLYLSAHGRVFPKGLGNCDNTLWSAVIQADYYHALWKDAIVAVDLYGELHNRTTPWTLLARLGGSYRMRGYYEGRYTDNNLITATVEIRQRIWRRIGCVVWGGAGNVFGSFGTFDWGHTLPNYGLGLRWELKHRVNVRIDYGFGRKTNGLVLNINEAF
ncbi:MAG: outer membrane protein assembly factor, partial [Alistipes sp.]|nr:outer membrane protein assembly factor [Alistipes sp.]